MSFDIFLSTNTAKNCGVKIDANAGYKLTLKAACVKTQFYFSYLSNVMIEKKRKEKKTQLIKLLILSNFSKFKQKLNFKSTKNFIGLFSLSQENNRGFHGCITIPLFWYFDVRFKNFRRVEEVITIKVDHYSAIQMMFI